MTIKRGINKGELGWEQVGVFERRIYKNHDAYLAKQAEKLPSRIGWCQQQDRNLEQHLTRRLGELNITRPGMAVLCLGARLGGEVRAFIRHGCFAIGVDINPGLDNQHVIYGDFHNLIFSPNSLDLVYINCFDHCNTPKRLLGQINRVLKLHDGILMMENKAGSRETGDRQPTGSDYWDCLEWPNIETLIEQVVKAGFKPIKNYYDRKTKAHPYGNILRKTR